MHKTVQQMLILFQQLTLCSNNQFKTMNMNEKVHQSTLQLQKDHRYAHLQCFFNIKEKVNFLTRQTLFLGIAVFDKYSEKIQQNTTPADQDLTLVETRVATCLWIAWKFNEVNKMPLKRLFDSIPSTDIQIESLVQMEAQILETIQFEIPIEIPYFELTKSFQAVMRDLTNSMAVVGQCLGFLKEGIICSSDFSLCGNLGRDILKLYTTKRCGDTRVRDVYKLIRQKRSGHLEKAISVA